MEITKLSQIIATRELDLCGNKAPVIVRIGMPQKFSDSSDFYCPFQIVGLGNQKVRRAGGVDSVQSLLFALKMIGVDLYTSKEAQAGRLKWKGGEIGDLGFPVPESISDLPPNH